MGDAHALLRRTAAKRLSTAARLERVATTHDVVRRAITFTDCQRQCPMGSDQSLTTRALGRRLPRTTSARKELK